MVYPPEQLLPWLTCRTNLTARLQAKSGDTVLQVLQQVWEEASPWDQDILELGQERVLHRDIVIRAWHKPCWFARTILPETTYQAHLALFARLKNESLGNLIFQTEAIQRLSLRHYAIDLQAPEYAWLSACLPMTQPKLWARLSHFQVGGVERFCLVEILLPDLEQYC